MKTGSWIALLLGLALTLGCTKKENDSKLAVFHGFEKDDVKTWDPAMRSDNASLDLCPKCL